MNWDEGWHTTSILSIIFKFLALCNQFHNLESRKHLKQQPPDHYCGSREFLCRFVFYGMYLFVVIGTEHHQDSVTETQAIIFLL